MERIRFFDRLPKSWRTLVEWRGPGAFTGWRMERGRLGGQSSFGGRLWATPV
jgi:hypothetical protein